MTEHRIDLSQLARIRDGSGHSTFAPSSSHMWLHCPGSLIPNLLASDPGNEDAAYGTVAHSVTEQWLREGRPPKHLLGTNQFIEGGEWGYLVEIDEEMFHYAQQCVDRCEWEPGRQLIEQKVWFSQLTPIPNQGGTMDFSALVPGAMRVKDHKFGKANTIYAEENSQLMLYALGILYRFDAEYHFEDIMIEVLQPRLAHFDEWYTTRKHLLEFADYVKERALIAWSHDAPRVPGPQQCRYCKVRSTCAANAMMQEELVASVFEAVGDEYSPQAMEAFKARLDDDLNDYDLQTVNVGTLTTYQLAKLLPHRQAAESWWTAMSAELYNRAARGEAIPGFKLVESRSRRRVSNEAMFVDVLHTHGVKEDEIWTKHLVSPAQAEKALRKRGVRQVDLPKVLAGAVEKPLGKATLVSVHDKRNAIVDLTQVVFVNEDDEGQSVNSEDEEI